MPIGIPLEDNKSKERTGMYVYSGICPDSPFYEKIKGQIEGDFNGENPELLYSMKFDKIRARM